MGLRDPFHLRDWKLEENPAPWRAFNPSWSKLFSRSNQGWILQDIDDGLGLQATLAECPWLEASCPSTPSLGWILGRVNRMEKEAELQLCGMGKDLVKESSQKLAGREQRERKYAE